MNSSHPSLGRLGRGALALALAVAPATGPVAAPGASAQVTAVGLHEAGATGIPSRADWVWPLAAFRIARPYVAPAHEYGPGHRGIDLQPLADGAVRAPQAGVIAFRGSVAGRPLITIDHGDGLVTTLEPVASALAPGTAVTRGEDVGTIALGGHTAPGTVHFGVRLYGEYVNPMLLLGGVRRAVLLPCCS
ncbi:murein hydrolase activator EnvC family protein [Microbacterium sp.]|uniref:murein hydrolase activator EnvC family protein n=1 Tax=Microbacterium sp. TaxID=51671 RepID=UPI003A94E975